jgi:hypothetical protein
MLAAAHGAPCTAGQSLNVPPAATSPQVKDRRETDVDWCVQLGSSALDAWHGT